MNIFSRFLNWVSGGRLFAEDRPEIKDELSDTVELDEPEELDELDDWDEPEIQQSGEAELPEFEVPDTDTASYNEYPTEEELWQLAEIYGDEAVPATELPEEPAADIEDEFPEFTDHTEENFWDIEVPPEIEAVEFLRELGFDFDPDLYTADELLNMADILSRTAMDNVAKLPDDADLRSVIQVLDLDDVIEALGNRAEYKRIVTTAAGSNYVIECKDSGNCLEEPEPEYEDYEIPL